MADTVSIGDLIESNIYFQEENEKLIETLSDLVLQNADLADLICELRKELLEFRDAKNNK